jgi:hypothetical protein
MILFDRVSCSKIADALIEYPRGTTDRLHISDEVDLLGWGSLQAASASGGQLSSFRRETLGSMLWNLKIPYWTFGGLLDENAKTSTHRI